MRNMPKDNFNRAMLLIQTARFIEEEYGTGALEALAKWKNDRNRERWREIAEESGRNDPEYLFRLFTDRVHEYKVIRKNRNALEVIVTKCAHSEVFHRFNAADVGSLDAIAEKMGQVRKDLESLGQEELAGAAIEALAALRRGDVAEFRRGRAFLQSKIGHLR